MLGLLALSLMGLVVKAQQLIGEIPQVIHEPSFMSLSAASKDPEFVRSVMQLEETMPAGYSLDPGIAMTADSTSLEELGDDPITTKLEQQEAAKESRSRRDVHGGGYDDRKNSGGGSSDEADGNSGEGFGFDNNAKAKLDEEMASAERAVAKYDKMFGRNSGNKFSTVGGDDSYGEGDGGSNNNDDYSGRRGRDGGGGDYAHTSGDTGYRGKSPESYARQLRGSPHNADSGNEYDGNDDDRTADGRGSYRPQSSYGSNNGGGDGDGDAYRTNSGDNYADDGKSDYSAERGRGFNRASDDDYGKDKGYGNENQNSGGYGNNNDYSEQGGDYKPVNREGSTSRTIDFHEKPKPKLKPYREILEEQDRQRESEGGSPFEANEDGYDGKTEGFDGNYKAEGFDDDQAPQGAGGGQSRENSGGGDGGGYGNNNEGVSSASQGPRDNDEKYATLDGPDYESQRGTDYYDRNKANDDSGEASHKVRIVLPAPQVPLSEATAAMKVRPPKAIHVRRKRAAPNEKAEVPHEQPTGEASSMEYSNTGFDPGDGNNGDMKEIPSSFDGIVAGGGFIDDIAPQAEVNSTTSSSTRMINYSAEEGIIPTRHADMEEDYMAKTGRELGPAPPGMDPADERFTIGHFKPVFPVDDPEEYADQDEGSRNSVGPVSDGDKDDDEDANHFNSEALRPVAAAYSSQSPNGNAPYGLPTVSPIPAPFKDATPSSRYPSIAFQGRAEFSPSPPAPQPPALPNPAALTNDLSPLRQVSPVPFSDEPPVTTTEDSASEGGTRYKHERTQIVEKRNILRSTYGNASPTQSNPVYRSVTHAVPVVTQYQQSQMVKTLSRRRRSAGSKIISLEIARNNVTAEFGRKSGKTLKFAGLSGVLKTGDDAVSGGNAKLSRKPRHAINAKAGCSVGESESNEDCVFEESRAHPAAVRAEPPKDLQTSSSKHMKEQTKVGSKEPLVTADTSDEEIMWGLQLSKTEPSGKRRSKVMVINTAEEPLKPTWLISPTPKPARGILGWLGFSRTPAKTFEEQIAADILGKLDNKERVIIEHSDDDTSQSLENEHKSEEPRRKRRRRRRKHHRRPHLSEEESRERFRPAFDRSHEDFEHERPERPRRKPLKLLVLPQSQEEPEEQANERLEIIQKFPKAHQVYREYRPRGRTGKVKEKILVYSSTFGEPVVTLPDVKHDQKREIPEDRTFRKRSDGPKIKILSLQREPPRPLLRSADVQPNAGIVRKNYVIVGRNVMTPGGGRTIRKMRTNGRTYTLIPKPKDIAEITVSSTIKVKEEK